MPRRDRTRRSELQRLAGDLGEVLPRVAHGTARLPAQGWYIKLDSTGTIRFLADHSMLAGAAITKLLSDRERESDAANA